MLFHQFNMRDFSVHMFYTNLFICTFIAQDTAAHPGATESGALSAGFTLQVCNQRASCGSA